MFLFKHGKIVGCVLFLLVSFTSCFSFWPRNEGENIGEKTCRDPERGILDKRPAHRDLAQVALEAADV